VLTGALLPNEAVKLILLDGEDHLEILKAIEEK
jgi:hypothetical protein